MNRDRIDDVAAASRSTTAAVGGARRRATVMSLAAAGLAICLAVPTSAGAATARATPTCRGATCNGKNPITTGCFRDADTVNQTEIFDTAVTQIVVELRYSKKCNATWSKAKALVGHDAAKVRRVTVWVNGYRTATVRSTTTATSIYSKMVGGKHNVTGEARYGSGLVLTDSLAFA